MENNRKKENFLAFGKPVFDEAEIQAVIDVLRSGWISTGPRTADFQRLFSEYVGKRRALGLSSCTAGLYLALRLFNIKEGDEVIVPAMTFAATANVVVHVGARPVFADVDEHTGIMRPESFKRLITKKTRAVMPVHLYGRPAEIIEISEIAKQNGIKVIADCAHATESRIDGKHVAEWSDIVSFSFYATKNLAVGEGGMLVSDDDELMDRAGVLALHGMSRDAFSRYSESGFKLYDIVEAGYKFNMTDISAALGIEQLKRLEGRLKKREQIWKIYDDAFQELPLELPEKVPENYRHARHLYTIKARNRKERDKLLTAIQSRGIGVGVHFTALHLHTFYREKFGYKRGDCPAAERISDTTISIPMTPYLTDEEIDRVVSAVTSACKEL